MNIAVAIDECHNSTLDNQCKQAVIDKLRAAGHTVADAGRGPSHVQNYARTHTIDMMLQIACGMCIGTLCDFSYGMYKGYYHAKRATIPIWTHGWTRENPETWKSGTAWDDTFSRNIPNSFRSTYGWGKTLPEVYSMHDEIGPFVHGRTGDEIANKLVQGLNGGNVNTGNTGNGGGGGQTGLDLIKQVITPWDKYGVVMAWHSLDRLDIERQSTKDATIIEEWMVVNDSISITDYNSDTPNFLQVGKYTVKNPNLIDRFGKIPVKDEVENKGKAWVQDMYQVSQRESGHTVDLKVIYTGLGKYRQYVYLDLPSVGIQGYYFVTKRSFEEDGVNLSITCEPAPPSRYMEPTEQTNINMDNADNGLGKDAISIGNALAAKYGFCSKVRCPAGGSPTESYEEMKRTGRGSCYAWSDALYTELNAVGIKARIIQYATGIAGNHRSVQILQNGQWVDYPYRSTNINEYARATTRKPGMFVQRQPP